MRVSLESQKNLKMRKESIQYKEPSGWEKLVNKLIRPPRHNYRPSQLGPSQFESKNGCYTRTEQIVIHQNKKINLTVITPTHKNFKVILYLHGNSSCKVQALSLLKYLPEEFSLASFDFLGCGNNEEAQTISLGVRQSQQIATVVNFLRQKHFNVILWGRSMGAASALKYGKVDIIVADSSFRSMKKLCKQFAKKNKPQCLPSCVVSCLFPCVFQKLKTDIKEKGNFNIEDLEIQESVKKISPTTTLIFILGTEDTLINQKHSQKLYDSFKGQKKYLQVVQGGHNSKRPDQTLKKIMNLIIKHSKQHQIVSKSIKIQEIELQPSFN